MIPFKAVIGEETFQAWGKFDLACFIDEPESLSSRLALLHQQLYSKRRESRAEAKTKYYQPFDTAEFDVQDPVLLW